MRATRPSDQYPDPSWSGWGDPEAALHLPDGQAAQRRNEYLIQIPERVAWIHSYDALAVGEA